jgi:hypothetical protein
MKRIHNLFKLTPLLFLLISVSSCEYNNRLKLREVPEKAFDIVDVEMRSNNFENNRRFWSKVMGFAVDSVAPNSFRVNIGFNSITFVNNSGAQDTSSSVTPKYQFTIAIPSNQIENCYAWLLDADSTNASKVAEPAKFWIDAETGSVIYRRNQYNSQSIYIKDAGNNIVEILARHDLNNTATGEFNRGMFLGITEVGVVSRDLRKSAEDLKAAYGVEEVVGSSNSYKPLGGPTGLLKLNIEGKIWTPTENEIAVSYPMTIRVRGDSLIQPITFASGVQLIAVQ